MAERVRTIRLHGEPGRLFGRVHRLAVQSSAEAVRALCILFPEFQAYLARSKDRGLAFAVFYGKRNIGEDELGHPPGNAEIRIAPVVQGSKNSGGLQVVLGIALMAAATIATGGVGGLAIAGASGWGGAFAAGGFAGATAMFGLSLAIGGVAQMITGQQAKIDSSESVDNRPSYNFTGIKNTITQGNPVPLCYGEMKTGSAQLSLGIRAEDQQ